MQKYCKCDCGNNLTFYGKYDFNIFPIGRISINEPCLFCKNCKKIYCDSKLSEEKYKIYNKKCRNILINLYNPCLHPELWMDIEEFSKVIKFDIDYILNCKKFFMTGIYNIKINQKYYFLRKSVDLYLKNGNGLFWLTKNKYSKEQVGCSWCGIGDKHLVNYHKSFNIKTGFFDIYYPIETCTYCGSFCADDNYFDLEKKKIEEILKKS